MALLLILLRTTLFQGLAASGFFNALTTTCFSINSELKRPRISMAEQGHINGLSMDREVAARFGKAF
jgi:hypothetical protein